MSSQRFKSILFFNTRRPERNNPHVTPRGIKEVVKVSMYLVFIYKEENKAGFSNIINHL